jgi:NAD(P)-dependent dehydrogenase (short-subunit alcohol dehydrogenase family)
MKWTLVTGGALRLGAEICRSVASTGRNIAIHYRNSKEQALLLQKDLLKMGVQAHIVQGDFSTLESTKQFLDHYLAHFPHTDVLINNVGNYSIGPASRTSPQELQDLLQVNTIAPLMLIQGLLPSLRQNRGHIVNIGIAGTSAAHANIHATAYNLTKLSLTMLTKSLAKELAPDVTVNMVSPGYLENSVDMPSDMSRIPSGRLGQFQEVADAVCFFISGRKGYITGQNLEVAGGIRM